MEKHSQKRTAKQSKGALDAGIESVKRIFTGEENFISMLKEDHKPLKELIQVIKDPNRSFEERRQAYKDFAPLLVTHAVAEEKSLYEFMKTKPDLREYAFEGDTEHSLADQMCEAIERVEDQDKMSAKIKVLAELVEHHIKEEENDIFPDVEKMVSPEQLQKLSEIYISQQEELIAEGQDNSPSESDLPH